MTTATATVPLWRERADFAAWRMRRIAICAVLVAMAFFQSPGRVAPDTKLDLVVNPLQFLGRATTMWDPAGFGGQLQNQAYGYLFPIGPFFAAGDAAGIPPWVIQRLWWSLILVLAFLGVATLARRLEIGTPTSQVLAALAFALSPRILSTIGPVSAETWPMVLAPWAIVPLVAAAHGGGYRRPVLVSALVVAAMGGVNAALSLAAVLPAALFLLTRRPNARSIRMAAWWVGGVLVAIAWWLVPLLLLGRYSPPFLDFIETADVTTSTTSIVEVLRGTSHWVAFLGPDLGSSWRLGHDLISQPILILDTAIVVAVGLTGLCLSGLKERGWLITMLLVGVFCVTFGHPGDFTSWFAAPERDLLDGVLAPLRNVHKFDPLIRLALVLGLAHAVSELAAHLRAVNRDQIVAIAVLGSLVTAVVGVGGPAFAGRLSADGAFVDIPPYWQQATSWLEQHPGARALLVPGSRFAVYDWGSPMDEPIQALTGSPWEVRNAIPLVPAGHIRYLDSVERTLASGQPSAGLAPLLARAGISYLVVRNDLDPLRSGATRPVLVGSVLEGSPGLERQASFGPDTAPPSTDRLFVDDGLRSQSRPALEIWSVEGETGAVRVDSVSDLTEVVGGPESLVNLATVGLLPAAPSVLATQLPDDVSLPQVAITDGLQRREVNFGLGLDDQSRVLTAQERYLLDRPQHDYAITTDDSMLTVARWEGVRDVEVSSSLSDVGAAGGEIATGPAAAFDGSETTSWLSDPAMGHAAWLRASLVAPVAVDTVSVRLPDPSLAPTSKVDVVTDNERASVTVDGQRDVVLDLSGKPTRTVQVDLTSPDGSTRPLGIADLAIAGVEADEVLVPPAVELEPGQRVALAFSAPPGHRDACVVGEDVLCSPLLERAGEEDQAVDRAFELPASYDFDVATADVAAVPGPWLDQAVRRVASGELSASASSSLVQDPLGGALATVDGTDSTGWVAGPQDPNPTLTLRWNQERAVDHVVLTWSDTLAAARPTRARIDIGKRTFERAIDADGAVSFPPIRANRLRLHLLAPLSAFSYDESTERSTQLPVGVSDVDVPGVSPTPVLGVGTPVDIPCGQGPEVVIDGQAHPTRVRTTVDELVRLGRVTAQICHLRVLGLAAGEHRVTLEATQAWRPISIQLSPSDWKQQAAAPMLPTVRTWTDTTRVLEVGPRPEAALLSVTENANDGWVASLDGETLEPVTVDGWQQGYWLPAGAAGTIRLTFEPEGGYRLGLIAGLALLLVLGAAAALAKNPSSLPAAEPARARSVTLAIVGVVALTSIGGTAGLLAGIAALGVRWALIRDASSETAVTVGWAVGCGVTYLVAGTVLAAWPWGSSNHDQVAGTVQLICLVSLAMVVAVVLPVGSRNQPS